MSDYEVKYIRVRVSPWLSRAIKYSAAVYGIGTQKLTEGLLAQALLQVSPELKKFADLAVSANILGVPKINEHHNPSSLSEDEISHTSKSKQFDKYHGLSPSDRATIEEFNRPSPHLERARQIREENERWTPDE